MDPTTLQLFVRVATAGAFAKAGREFDLSPTAATQRIKNLETELGVRLFNRTTRSVALTAEGELFLAHAHKIITSVEDARSDLAMHRHNIKGELRVTSSATFGWRYIAPFISEFLSEYPDVSVKLELGDRVVDIVEQGYDLSLRIGTLQSSTLVARRLADNPRLLVCSPEYLKQHPGPLTPVDLAAHQCLVLSENNKWQLRHNNGRQHEVRVSGKFYCNYGEAITEAALKGTGIALKSLWDIRDHLQQGTLVALLPDYQVEPMWSLWAVRPPGSLVPARVRVFTDFIAHKITTLEKQWSSEK